MRFPGMNAQVVVKKLKRFNVAQQRSEMYVKEQTQSSPKHVIYHNHIAAASCFCLTESMSTPACPEGLLAVLNHRGMAACDTAWADPPLVADPGHRMQGMAPAAGERLLPQGPV